MRYVSVCSGIESATVAWAPLGWTPVAFAEIDKFPSAVLAHHYPDVPNLGDFTKIRGEDYRGAVDLIVGGTPCQDFSIAGKRAGMAGERGGLALAFVDLVRAVSPRWIVWENVPGVLSSGGGNDFADFLLALRQCGYHVGYRVLDAQYFGVPQRRRRVFVVGYFGDWRPVAAVLFEPESLRGHIAPRRKTQTDVAGPIKASLGGRGFPQDPEAASGGYLQVAGTLRSGAANGSAGHGARSEDKDTNLILHESAYGGNFAGEIDVATTLKAGNQRLDLESETFIALPLRAEGHDASEDGTGRQNLIPIAFHGSQDPGVSGDVTHPCGRNGGRETCVAFTQNQQGDVLTGTVAPAIGTNSNATGRNTAKVFETSAVRRLTPKECERLQGFPDGYTAIPYRRPFANLSKPIIERSYSRYLRRMERQGRTALSLDELVRCADGPRYKALG
ncbi:MAG: DNA (cytosine-5-)-methyltransferase, partial [Desulfovibrio sp.]|nr:DNA (cytosine-5-)-methyltransferase [Desulfovibrio sp.]